MAFAVVLDVQAGAGRLVASAEAIEIRGASEIVLRIAAESGFRDFDHLPDRSPPTALLDAARRRSFTVLLDAHVTDHRRLYRRSTLTSPSRSTDVPTGRRWRGNAAMSDPGLAALLFNLGRYLLIASSSAGSMPANLQGI